MELGIDHIGLNTINQSKGATKKTPTRTCTSGSKYIKKQFLLLVKEAGYDSWSSALQELMKVVMVSGADLNINFLPGDKSARTCTVGEVALKEEFYKWGVDNGMQSWSTALQSIMIGVVEGSIPLEKNEVKD